MQVHVVRHSRSLFFVRSDVNKKTNRSFHLNVYGTWFEVCNRDILATDILENLCLADIRWLVNHKKSMHPGQEQRI